MATFQLHTLPVPESRDGAARALASGLQPLRQTVDSADDRIVLPALQPGKLHMIVGPSGSGKTTFALNIILKFYTGVFDQIIIVQPPETTKSFVVDPWARVPKECRLPGLDVADVARLLALVRKAAKKRHRTFLFIDDSIRFLGNDADKTLIPLFFQKRQNLLTIMVLGQRFASFGKWLRSAPDEITVFRPNTDEETGQIVTELSFGLGEKDGVEIFNMLWNGAVDAENHDSGTSVAATISDHPQATGEMSATKRHPAVTFNMEYRAFFLNFTPLEILVHLRNGQNIVFAPPSVEAQIAAARATPREAKRVHSDDEEEEGKEWGLRRYAHEFEAKLEREQKQLATARLASDALFRLGAPGHGSLHEKVLAGALYAARNDTPAHLMFGHDRGILASAHAMLASRDPETYRRELANTAQSNPVPESDPLRKLAWHPQSVEVRRKISRLIRAGRK